MCLIDIVVPLFHFDNSINDIDEIRAEFDRTTEYKTKSSSIKTHPLSHTHPQKNALSQKYKWSSNHNLKFLNLKLMAATKRATKKNLDKFLINENIPSWKNVYESLWDALSKSRAISIESVFIIQLHFAILQTIHWNNAWKRIFHIEKRQLYNDSVRHSTFIFHLAHRKRQILHTRSLTSPGKRQSVTEKNAIECRKVDKKVINSLNLTWILLLPSKSAFLTIIPLSV